LKQENQYLKKNLSEKNEENSRLKNLNQRLLEQIIKLKEEKLENPDIKDIDKSDNEQNSRLKNHNQNLHTQIKKLKNDKKSLENKLELLIEKEASKFPKRTNLTYGKWNNYKFNPRHNSRSCEVN
jgi:hypothetical protein